MLCKVRLAPCQPPWSVVLGSDLGACLGVRGAPPCPPHWIQPGRRRGPRPLWGEMERGRRATGRRVADGPDPSWGLHGGQPQPWMGSPEGGGSGPPPNTEGWSPPPDLELVKGQENFRFCGRLKGQGRFFPPGKILEHCTMENTKASHNFIA